MSIDNLPPTWSIVRQAIIRSGLTRKEISKISKVSIHDIDSFETAKEIPDFNTLDKIISACDLELRFVLTKPDEFRNDDLKANQKRSLEERFSINLNSVAFAIETQKHTDE